MLLSMLIALAFGVDNDDFKNIKWSHAEIHYSHKNQIEGVSNQTSAHLEYRS